MRDLKLSEVLFEFQQVGNAVKVCAIDPATRTEVSIVGAPNMSPFTLKMHALRKLKHVLAQGDKEKPDRWAGL